MEAILSFIQNFFEKELDFFGIRKKYFLGFSICFSFGRQLCQNCGWAGSEPYVPSHITEPPCLHRDMVK